jgi:hypothetical protein
MTLASEPMPRLTNYESIWSLRTTNTKSYEVRFLDVKSPWKTLGAPIAAMVRIDVRYIDPILIDSVCQSSFES